MNGSPSIVLIAGPVGILTHLKIALFFGLPEPTGVHTMIVAKPFATRHGLKWTGLKRRPIKTVIRARCG